MTGERTAKKDRDPIMMICLVVFAIAAVAVSGIYVANNFFPSGDDMASTGDKVTVNYTGTYYDEYGNEIAVVFDTSKSDIANNDDIAKSNDFTKKDSYSTLQFTVGSNTMIEAFENSVIGKKVGDKYSIEIPGAKAYFGASTYGAMSTTGNTMPASVTMTSSEFSSKDSDVKLVNGQTKMFTSEFGWEAQATLTEDKTVVITYLPEVSSEGYLVYDNGTTSVYFIVTAVDDSVITFDVKIENPQKTTLNQIQMIKLNLTDKVIYITEIDSDGGIIYKSGAEKVNEILYFDIEIVKIE